jgi:uncharacterized delta-60 repeat protein
MGRREIARLLIATLGTMGAGGCALLATLDEHTTAIDTPVEAGPDATREASSDTLVLELALHDTTVPPKSSFPVKFKITRSGAPSPVTVSVKGTSNVTAPPVLLQANESEGELAIAVGEDPAVETASLEVTAKSNDAIAAPQTLVVKIAGASGTLDTTLAGTGLISPDVTSTGDADALALAVGPDGTIVVVGAAPPPASTQSAFVALRLKPNGTPDPSFGTAGLVFLPFTASSSATAVALESNGSIVIAGSTNPGTRLFAIARLLPSGAPDPTFGLGGSMASGVDGGDVSLGGVVSFDGGVVATGAATFADGDYVAFVRMPSDGGVVVDVVPRGSTKPERGNAIVLTRDGKLVTAATRNTSGGLFSSSVGLVMRTARDGTPDDSFGAKGTVVLSEAVLNAVAEAPGDTLVLGGGMQPTATTMKAAPTMLTRVHADGGNDPSFGAQGTVVVDAGLAATGVAIQKDAKIAAAATIKTGLNLSQAAVLRFTSAGALDTTFGPTGIVALHGPSIASQATAIAIQPDGRIVVTGYVRQNAVDRFFVARLWP